MIEKVNTKDFGFITFKSEEIEKILSIFGHEKLKMAKCWSCGEEMWASDIGHILPDADRKPIFLCSSSICFADYCNRVLED